MIRHWDIQSDLVDSLDTHAIEGALAEVASDPEESRAWQGCVALTFSQFEAGGPPYIEPPVRGYLRTLYDRVPHLPYFLIDEPLAGSLMAFLSAHGPENATTVAAGNTTVAPTEEAVNALLRHMIATAGFAASVDDDAERVVSRFVAPLGEALRGPVVAAALDGAGLR
jgi:hypothetical protein